MKKVYVGCGIHQKDTPYALPKSGIVIKVYEDEWHKMVSIMWQDSKVEDYTINTIMNENRFKIIDRELTEEDRWYA